MVETRFFYGQKMYINALVSATEHKENITFSVPGEENISMSLDEIAEKINNRNMIKTIKYLFFEDIRKKFETYDANIEIEISVHYSHTTCYIQFVFYTLGENTHYLNDIVKNISFTHVKSKDNEYLDDVC